MKRIHRTARNATYYILFMTLIVLVAVTALAQGQTKRSRRVPPVTGNVQPNVAPTLRPAFQGFPVDQPREIDLEIDENAVVGLTSREQLDQIRDWLLFTVVADAGLNADTTNKILFDLPTSRRGYMTPVASFEYGLTRSRVVGNGRIVALIPQVDNDAERLDELAQIVDEHRKNLGALPESIVVFDYTIDPATQAAQVTRRAELNARQFFTSAYGYYETPITNMVDFERFMGRVDDVTYATLNNGTLILGGRKIKSRSFRGISVEDVAALWQSEEVIKGKADRFEALTNKLEKDFNKAWQLFGRATDALSEGNTAVAKANLFILKQLFIAETAESGAIFSEGAGKPTPTPGSSAYVGLTELFKAYELDDVGGYNKLIAAMGNIKEKDWAAVQAFVDEEERQIKPVDASGFSLDPTYDFDGLRQFFTREHEPALRALAAKGSSGITIADVEEVKAGFSKKNSDPLFVLQRKLTEGGDPDLAKEIGDGARKYRFQHARYDGELRGTEVGMVLFYTDLLAKLWALDFKNNVPRAQVADFYSLMDTPVAVTHLSNILEASRTRVWFGPKNKGFQLAGDNRNRVLFDRIATRVYSASSDPYYPGREVEANAQSAAFLGWWDNHYEEIAGYEPEYERLNEIMKWSVIVGWLNQSNHLTTLNFLNDVKVDRSNVFPEWVRRQPQLRFKQWDQIGFHPAGYKGSDTEALPILAVDGMLFGEKATLEGGVSLAGKRTIAERVPLTSQVKVPEIARRSDLSYSKPAKGTAVGSYTNLEGTKWQPVTRSANQAELFAVAKKGVARRDAAVELPADVTYKRTMTLNPDGVQLETKANQIPLSNLNIRRTNNGFKVGAQSRAMDLAHVVARRLSVSQDPRTFLQEAPEVEQAYLTQNGRSFLIKTRGAQQWLRVSYENPSTSSQPWELRVAELGDYADVVRLKWISDSQAQVERATATLLRGPSDNSNLARVDTFLLNDKPVNAIRTLDELPPGEAAQPYVLLRRAVAELQRNRSERAYDNLRQLMDNRPDREGVFNEISALLSGSKLLPSGSKLLPVQRGERIAFVYDARLGKPLSTNEAKAIELEGSYLYIEDKPGLNNIDWSPGMESRTLQQVLSRDLGTVVELPRGEISRFKPAFIRDGGGRGGSGGERGAPREFRSVRESLPTTPIRTSQIIPCVASDDDDRKPRRRDDRSVSCRNREKKDGRVYVVIAR